jgi:hypothetical protein
MQVTSSIQLLQVFNGGKPCGWLGQTSTGFWFHYSSNNFEQNWVSLLMPPSTNFYEQEELFQVFAQHLPSAHNQHSSLDLLHQLNGKQLGTLSFANPDNPVVKSPVCVLPAALPNQAFPEIETGQYMLISTQQRKPFADTLVHHVSKWSLVQQLQAIKQKIDPNSRLHGLRWALQTQYSNHAIWYTRPDLDTYRQQFLGFEAVRSVFNLNSDDYANLVLNGSRFDRILQELIRTYCKNFALEIELMQALLPMLIDGQINASLVYQTKTPSESSYRPIVLGMEYLPV